MHSNLQIFASIFFALVTGGATGAACWWLIRQRRSRLPLLLALLTLLSWVGGCYLADRVAKRERTRLEQLLLGYAHIFAQQLQRLGHEQISANTPPDDPIYLELIQAERDWLATVPLAQDIYTMRQRPDGRAVLVVDSETDYDHNGDFLGKSEQRTPIGELYGSEELDPGVQKAFAGEGNFYGVPVSDRWGNWVTAAWPLFNSQHQVDAIIGIDYDASDYWQTGHEACWRMFAYTTVLHLALIGTITLVASARWRSEDQARAAAEIKRTEDRFRVFMQHSPAVAFVKDEDGRYCFVNAAFEKQIGRSHQDVLGRNDSDLQSAIMALELHQNDERVFETGCAIEVMESVSDRSGKTRKWWVAKFPLPEEGNRRQIGGVAIDVTAQAELEEQLRQTQKMESVGQLAAGIAHDFNNALTVISNCAELIEDAAADEQTARKHAKLIRRSAEGAAGLVQRLMQFSRKQPVQKRSVNIASLLRQTEAMLARTLGAHVAVEISSPDNLPAIVGDAVALEQVLVNLAVNARDAMPDGGTLSLGVEEVTLTNAKGHKARNGHFLCITVSDDGCGMSREVMTHLFEPFFTTKKMGAGTGLGLASAYGIVQQHGGWIAADSTVGRGSTFKIHLPVNSAEPLPREESENLEANFPAKGDASMFAGKRVLVVEDNVGVKLTFRALLKRDGWEVIEAGNMAEAEEIWLQKKSGIDLVITDLVMPGKGTGRDFALRILEDHDQTPVICTTGYSPDVAGVLDLDPERVGFLAKPFTPSELRQLIRRLLPGPVGAAS